MHTSPVYRFTSWLCRMVRRTCPLLHFTCMTRCAGSTATSTSRARPCTPTPAPCKWRQDTGRVRSTFQRMVSRTSFGQEDPQLVGWFPLPQLLLSVPFILFQSTTIGTRRKERAWVLQSLWAVLEAPSSSSHWQRSWLLWVLMTNTGDNSNDWLTF